MAMLRAILHHEDLAIALDDRSLDLADFFVEQNFGGQVTIENLLADFGYALGTQRVGAARPPQRRLGLLIRLQQRLVRPLRRRRRIRLDAVQTFEYKPGARGAHGDGFFYILNRLVHVAVYLSAARAVVAVG